jgi:hypothetical protein
MLMASQNPQLHTITVGWIGLYWTLFTAIRF